ncbi:signal peptidase I [Candidatus Woesearchaeota archaeon]|nr:signal peptidase I [Candidatus Woesearchaeota archaeon]
MESTKILKKAWRFIWEDNSVWSWLANLAIAFVLIKFIVYPGLGFLLQTSHPVVAVVSESMEHNGNFDEWWEKANGKYAVNNIIVEKWYINNGIEKRDFAAFPFKNGFNKGDIMVLRGKKPEAVKTGDIIVFWNAKGDPIIHRVLKGWQQDNIYYFQTKGDNYATNPLPIRSPFLDETRISQDMLVGNAILRIPLLGYVKIWFVEFIYRPIFSPLMNYFGVVS